MTRGVHRRRTRLAATTACAWLLSPPVSEAGPQTAPPAQGVAPAVEAERVPNPSVLDETTLVASARMGVVIQTRRITPLSRPASTVTSPPAPTRMITSRGIDASYRPYDAP